MTVKIAYEKLKSLFPPPYRWAMKRDFQNTTVTSHITEKIENHGYATGEEEVYNCSVVVHIWQEPCVDLITFSSNKTPLINAYEDVEKQIKEYFNAIKRLSI